MIDAYDKPSYLKKIQNIQNIKNLMLQIIFIFLIECEGVLTGEGRAWLKMPIFNTFSRNVNTVNLKIFPNHGGTYRFERKFKKHSGER